MSTAPIYEALLIPARQACGVAHQNGRRNRSCCGCASWSLSPPCGTCYSAPNICSLLPESWPVRPARLRFRGWQLSLTGHLNRGNLSTKCSGLLLRSSFAILTARTRHLISVAPMPAFSVASRPSNSSDIDALISIPKHKSINGCPKNAGRCPKKAEPFDRRSQPATSFVQKRGQQAGRNGEKWLN